LEIKRSAFRLECPRVKTKAITLRDRLRVQRNKPLRAGQLSILERAQKFAREVELYYSDIPSDPIAAATFYFSCRTKENHHPDQGVNRQGVLAFLRHAHTTYIAIMPIFTREPYALAVREILHERLESMAIALNIELPAQ
jgi:hypothetical protein